MLLKQSTTRNIMVLMVSSTDHITGVAGATLTITASKNGGAFASITPTVTDRGNGWYSLALTTAHTDTLGDLALRITAAGCDPTDLTRQVVTLLPGEDVTVAEIAPDAISSFTIQDGSLTSAKFAAGAITSAVAPNLDAAVSTRLATASYVAPDNTTIGALAGRLDTTRCDNLENLDVAVSSRLATTGYTAPANADIATILTRTDVATSTRLSSAGYTAPDNAGITTLTTRLSAGRATNLDNLDATVSSRLATAGYTAPANADIAAIKAKTDSLTFTVAGLLNVNTYRMNGAVLTGDGTSGNLWRGQ